MSVTWNFHFDYVPNQSSTVHFHEFVGLFNVCYRTTYDLKLRLVRYLVQLNGTGKLQKPFSWNDQLYSIYKHILVHVINKTQIQPLVAPWLKYYSSNLSYLSSLIIMISLVRESFIWPSNSR